MTPTIRRLIAVAAACALVAACAQGAEDATSTSTARDSGDEPRQPTALDATFTAAGIGIVDDLGAERTEDGTSAIRLWSWQVDTMAAEMDEGAGYLGADLDGLLGSPGGLPFSYLLAGWLSQPATPIAETAADLMGDQAWHQAPLITYPTAVLVLFVADAERAAATADGDAAGFDGNAVRAVLAQSDGGLCSSVVNFVNDVLTALFDLFKVDAGDGLLGWLGAIWNTAVDLVQGVVTGLIETLTGPVVKAIQAALFVVGTLSMVASIVKPWQLTVTPDAATTRFAVGAEPDIHNAFTAKVATGLPEWPDVVIDCAAAAGLELFDPGDASGAAVKWGVVGFPELGSPGAIAEVIGSDQQAAYRWVTGREESDRGEERDGIVAAGVSVQPNSIDALKALVDGLISGIVPELPFAGTATELFDGLIAPIFDELTELVKVQGSAHSVVVFHDDPPPACVVGTWVSQQFTVPNGADPPAVGGAGAVVTIDEEGNVRWDLSQVAPWVMDLAFVDSTFTDSGSATGTYTVDEAEDGTGSWMAAVDTGGVVSAVNGGSVPAPLFSVYVLMAAGSYACSDSALVFSTADANGAPVTVPLVRTSD